MAGRGRARSFPARSRQRDLDRAEAALPRVQPGPDVAGPRRYAQLGRGRESFPRDRRAPTCTLMASDRRWADLEVPLPHRAGPEDHVQRNRTDRDSRRRAGGLPAAPRTSTTTPLSPARPTAASRSARGRTPDSRDIRTAQPCCRTGGSCWSTATGTSPLESAPAFSTRKPPISRRVRKSSYAMTAATAISGILGSLPWPTAATWWYTTSTGTTARGTSPARCFPRDKRGVSPQISEVPFSWPRFSRNVGKAQSPALQWPRG